MWFELGPSNASLRWFVSIPELGDAPTDSSVHVHKRQHCVRRLAGFGNGEGAPASANSGQE